MTAVADTATSCAFISASGTSASITKTYQARAADRFLILRHAITVLLGHMQVLIMPIAVQHSAIAADQCKVVLACRHAR